jgi:Zn-dependent peptidase ImmA (M78 family)
VKKLDEENRAAELLQECLTRLSDRPLSDVTDRFERTPRSQRDAVQRALEGAQALSQGVPAGLVAQSVLNRVVESLKKRAELQERLPALREALAPLRPHEGFAHPSGEDVLAAICGHLGLSVEEVANGRPVGKRTTASTLPPLPIAAGERATERYWGSSAPVDPVVIAEQLGILVVDVPCEDLEACIVLGADCSVLAVSTRLEDEPRRRFAIAHEIGHYVLHRNHACVFSDAFVEAAGREERDKEASAFAAALLMPEALLRREGPLSWPSMRRAEELAAEFRVSLTGAALRLVNRCDFPSMLIAFWQGKAEWTVRSEYFPVTFRSGRTPPDDSETARVMDGEPPVPDYGEIHASEWFPKVQKVENGRIQEHAREVHPGFVLTILNMVG